MKKGITAISLGVTVIVLLILVTVVGISGIATYNTSLKLGFAVELANVEVSVDNYYEKTGEYPVKRNISVDISNVTEKSKEQFNKESILDNKVILQEIDYEILGFKTLKYGLGNNGENDIYAVSEKTGIVYYVKGLSVDGYTHYMLNEELSKLANFNANTVNNSTEDGIIYTPSSAKWTKNNVNVEVRIPKSIVVTSVVKGETNIVNNSSDNNESYYVYKVDNIDSNLDIKVSYTVNGNNKTSVYNVRNIDKIVPTLNVSDDQKLINTKEDKYGYVSINYLDELSDIKVIKYENEEIGSNTAEGKLEIENYFKTNGKTIYNEILQINPEVKKITVYAEDNAGNWTAKYVTVDENIYKALLSVNNKIPTEIVSNNTIYIDSNGDEAIIPKGFKVSNVASEQKIADGLVVKDINENEYVWVPVSDGTLDRKNFNIGSITIDQTTEEIPNELSTSVNKYKGFYIARYEAGINVAQTSTSTTPEDGSVKPLSKPGVNIWNYIPYDSNNSNSDTPTGTGAYKVATNLYLKGDDAVGVTSTLIYGAQWDEALKFIETKDSTYPTVSTGKGNYDTCSERITGYYSSNNIYDMAGNVWDRTMEKKQENFVYRGGGYGDLSVNDAAGDRHAYRTSDFKDHWLRL